MLARFTIGVLEQLLEGYGIGHRRLAEAAGRRNDERVALRVGEQLR
jgi:hypothetical protein